ncbi:hypothetical protein DFH29DRAFT_805036 [Suillus ampliporus]|nr:hypothetical protein DFH29DRAFT_805036 [Suillus ampliporus]
MRTLHVEEERAKESSSHVASGSRDFVQGFTLPGEAEKAAKILESFLGVSALNSIPTAVLQRARGLAVFQVLKAGFIFSGKAGSGLVIAWLPDGSGLRPRASQPVGSGGTSTVTHAMDMSV